VSRTLLAPVSYGLGDLVVSLPAVQALVAGGRPAWLVARAPSQRLLAQRIEGLAGVVDEGTDTGRPGDRLIDLRDHPLQRDFWWGSAEFEDAFGQMNINDILERICADLGVPADFSRPVPLEKRPRTGLDRTVLLVHETDGTAKSWPSERWAEIAALLRGDGHHVAHVTRGTGPTPLDDMGVDALVAATPPDAVDVLSACRGVIGVDTGLTHIAVQQGTPTVTICRRSSVYVRPWPHSAALRGSACTDLCRAAETAAAYNRTVSLRDFRPPLRPCPSGSACLAGTRAAEAVALLGSLL
jgi:Glycosyltransferase family 9 (heptosyltransferase)